MPEDSLPPFFEDFRSEADDLLTEMGLILEDLEHVRLAVRKERLDTFLRNVHTLKGLIGMVGFDEAGEIAHQLEGFLIAGQSVLSFDRKQVDMLIGATKALRQSIESPESGPKLVKKYRKLLVLDRATEGADGASQGKSGMIEEPGWIAELPESVGQALSPSDIDLVESGLSDGRGLVLATFMPSKELSESGVTVNSVREVLSRRTDLVRVAPCVQGVSVSFAFLTLVETDTTFDDLALEAQTLREVVKERAELAVEKYASPSRVGVRVDVDRLDEVMRHVENLVVSRYRLEQRLGELGLSRSTGAPVREACLSIQRELRDLTEAVMRVRLVPLSDVFRRMPLVVRDLARETRKQVDLELKGDETRLDKGLVEQLIDPLVHLVRNAVAHGLEEPEERTAIAKPPVGKLCLSAKPDGNSVVITLSDDGRGIDSKRLRRLTGQTAEEETLLDLICRPGLSVREEAGLDAGRGMGMEIVRRSIEGMGGQLEVESVDGEGTRFFLILPLTMAILDVFIVESQDQLFAIPSDVVEEIVELDTDVVTPVQQGEMLTLRGQAHPLLRLPRLLGMPSGTRDERYALVYEGASSRVAIGVNRVQGIREVVVRPLRDPLVSRPWVAGAAELGDGRLVLILHLSAFFAEASV